MVTRPRTVALVLHTAAHSGPARNFASRFRGTNDRLHVYAPRYGPALDLYRGVAETHVVPYERLMMPRTLGSLTRGVLAFAREVVMFRRLFTKRAIDTVVCATTVTPAPALAARLSGLTSVVYCGELYELDQTESSARRLAYRATTAAVPRLADLVICCSDLAAAQFGSDGGSVVRLYPPIDRTRSARDPREARAMFNLPLDTPIVVVVGSLSSARGQDTAISALNLLRQRRGPPALAIAGAPGDGPGDDRYARRLVEMAASNSTQSTVHFLGPVSDVPALLTAANVFVNPARYPEPFGRVAFEALALGVPAIVTRTGAQTELLRDEHSALVVPPNDPPALANAISRILDSPALSNQLVNGAADSLQALDPDLDRARFRQLMQDIK